MTSGIGEAWRLTLQGAAVLFVMFLIYVCLYHGLKQSNHKYGLSKLVGNYDRTHLASAGKLGILRSMQSNHEVTFAEVKSHVLTAVTTSTKLLLWQLKGIRSLLQACGSATAG